MPKSKDKEKGKSDIYTDIILEHGHGAFFYQPLTYPNKRNEHGIAIPSDHAIEAERDWNIEHKL